jgi:drug/metabolite transporter (DMT)-like permease
MSVHDVGASPAMAALLAAISAVAFGIGDFLGGLSARRMAAAATALVAQLAGLVLLLLLAPFVGGAVGGTDLAWGAAAGVAGAVGLMLFYSALSAGQMSVVTPVSAVMSALVPLVFGLVDGERPGGLALAGALLALPAIVLISREPGDQRAGDELDEPSRRSTPGRVVIAAAVSGIGFGTFFVLITRAGHDSGLWPLASARSTAALIVAVVLVAGRRPPTEPGGLRLALAAGVFDVSANALFLVASRHGLLTLVGVIGAMYPASTVVLARVVLKERLAAHQLLGLALAAASLIAVTAG